LRLRHCRPSYPIAEALKARLIPFVFVTGYGASGLDHKYRDYPILAKPFVQSDIGATLSKLLRKGYAAVRRACCRGMSAICAKRSLRIATGDDEVGENQRRRSRAPRRAHCLRPIAIASVAAAGRLAL